MKLKNKIAALAVCATLAAGSVFGFAACNADNGGSAAGDADIREVYSLYVASAEEAGNDPLTYEEWLESIKGAKGDDGITPHIGDDGYWWVGSKKTDVKAQGENGENAITPHIGANGNWFIGEEDTHVPATGPKGTDGNNGANGTSFRHGHGKPAADLGIAGDLYLDIDEWDVYEKTESGWSEEPIGNIKGEKGDKGDPGTGGTAEPEEITVDITAGGQQEISVAGLSAGTHLIIMDLGDVTLANSSSIRVQVGEGYPSEIVKSEARSTESGKNIYYGYLVVPEAATTATVSAIGEDVKATVTFEDYAAPTLEVGKAIEVPINAKDTAEGNIIKFKLASGLSGKYSFQITYSSQSSKSTGTYFVTKTAKSRLTNFTRAWDVTISEADYETDGDTFVYLILINMNVSSENLQFTIPVTLTITAA